MKIKTLVALAFSAITLLSSSHAEERTIVDGAYSVTLTNGWTDSEEENEDALIFVEKSSMAFDISGNVYETVEEIDLATIAKDAAESVKANMDGAKVSKVSDGKVNGMPAKFFSYKFNFELEGTNYQMTTRMMFVQSENFVFYMTGITQQNTTKTETQELMKIMKTFKKK